MTAWRALVDEGRLQSGESVLVQGTGGVSIIALQFAKEMGAKVIATTSSEEKAEKLKALGEQMKSLITKNILNGEKKFWNSQITKVSIMLLK